MCVCVCVCARAYLCIYINVIVIFELQTNIYCKNEGISSSMPEDGNRSGFRKLVFKKTDNKQSPRKEVLSVSHKPSSQPSSDEMIYVFTEEDLFLPSSIEPRSLGLSLHTDWDIPLQFINSKELSLQSSAMYLDKVYPTMCLIRPESGTVGQSYLTST
jgi:hypothetical protein